MFISLQLLTSLQFLSLFRLLKNIKDCVLDKYEWFWPQYIPLINIDLTYGVIVQYHWGDWIFNNDKDNNNDINILWCDLQPFGENFIKTALSSSQLF